MTKKLIKEIEEKIHEDIDMKVELTNRDIEAIEEQWEDYINFDRMEVFGSVETIDLWIDEAIEDNVTILSYEFDQFYNYEAAKQYLRDTEFDDMVVLDCGVVLWMR